MPHDIAISRAAEALARLHEDCVSLQDFDTPESLAKMSLADMQRRQALDRITQEVEALSAYLNAFSLTQDLDAALKAVHLAELRDRLAAETPQPEPVSGEPDLF